MARKKKQEEMVYLEIIKNNNFVIYSDKTEISIDDLYRKNDFFEVITICMSKDAYNSEKNKDLRKNSKLLEVDGHVILSCEKTSEDYIAGVLLVKNKSSDNDCYIYYDNDEKKEHISTFGDKMVIITKLDWMSEKNIKLRGDYMFCISYKLFFL